MTIREGKWKCTYCDAMNRGRDLKCVGCGATREQDVEFIYDENAPEVAGEAQLQEAMAGPEWLCETCATSNPSAREQCRQCGAPRGGSRAREVKMIGEQAAPPPPPTKFPLKPIAVVAASLIVLFGIIFFYFSRTHETRLTVAGVQWQRAIEVEELKTLVEQGWEDQVPSDARTLSRRREFHHNEHVQIGTRPVEQTYTEKVQVSTKKVKTGTKNLGNGYFQDIYKDEPVYENRTRTKVVQEPIYRDEPIYKDKVTYEVDRWKVARTEQAESRDNSPIWPKITEGPKMRAGKRTEKYLIQLKDPKSGKTYEQEVSETDFAHFIPGSICSATISNTGAIKKLAPQVK